ncbi:MAG: hypothetical protein R3A10_05920 [Caldilineaceae bacterium]
MRGRIQEADLSVPDRWGDYFYYARTEEGQQYPIYCRKRGTSARRKRCCAGPERAGSGP